MNRKNLVKILHSSYERHSSMKAWICWYCGSNANTEDHIPALTIAYSYPEINRILVRSCHLCNNALSNRALFCLFSRIEYLIKYYRKKWKKDLNIPDWSESQINSLTGYLKRKIILAMKRKERAMNVLKNLQINLNTLNECL